MERVTFNATGQVRRDTLEGREHIVVPMSMMAEGVIPGSSGALFYPGEELGKTPAVWNHKPVVIYHPKAGASACDVSVLNSMKVGVILNTKYTDKLRAEAWVEESRIMEVDSRVMDAINNNQTLELSTGLFTDNDNTPGVYNGRAYDSTARNYRPDHLAILPDEIGAYGVADGGGFLRLNQAVNTAGFHGAQRILNQLHKTLEGMGLTANMSDGNRRDLLNRMLREEYHTKGMDGPWIEAVYSDKKFLVMEYDGKLYKQSYAMEDNVPTLVGDKVEVQQITEYRTVDGGAFVGNTKDGEPTEEPVMNKKEIVGTLISNERFAEDRREYLMGLEEDVLTDMINNSMPKSLADAKKKKGKGKAADEDDEDKAKDAVKNEATPASEVDVVGNLATAMGIDPVALTGAVQGLVANGVAQKSGLVDSIVANGSSDLTKEELDALPMPVLAKLAKQYGTPPVHNYSGAAGFGGTITANAATDDKEEALELPVMSFDEN